MMFKFIFLLCVFCVSCASESFQDQMQIYRDIASSVDRIKTQQDQFFAADRVCYTDVGCFSKDGPMKHTLTLPSSPEKIGTVFHAYTAANPTGSQIVLPHNPSTFGLIDAKKRLVIIMHGFGNSHETAELQSIKDNLLNYANHEVGSVIVVDWKMGAAQPFYNVAAANVQVVGRQVAHLVNELHRNHGVNPLNVYLIGFSLGAQSAGFAGKWSQSEYKWKFGRITGLDAAAPFFEGHPGAHLTKDDAQFVDAIHTSAGNNILLGEIGFVDSYGHVDFYPNSGRKQPHCTNLFQISCNHYASVLFYDASLSAHISCLFKAYSCADWKTFVADMQTCSKSDIELGYWADDSLAIGDRWLSTTKNYPFC